MASRPARVLAEFKATTAAELAEVRIELAALRQLKHQLIAETTGLSIREAAAVLGVSRSVVHRARLSLKPQRMAS